MKPSFFDRLADRARSIDSLLCIGLDPRLSLPADSEMSEVVRTLVETNKRIIDETASIAAAYKPNIAFYEAYGVPGIEALLISLGLIPDEVPVILDAKRGDIGPTAEAYAKAVFTAFGADAVTVSPYMGKDSVEPFLAYEDRGIFVLCRTSNPGSLEFQASSLANGHSLYRQVAETATSWAPDRIGLVVGGNQPDILAELRAVLPKTWFLAPGIGAQGGDAAAAIEAGIDAEGLGVLPVVARGIAQAENPAAAARGFRDQMNQARDAALARGRVSAARRSNAASNSFSPKMAGTANQGQVLAGANLVERVLTGLVDAECFRTGEFTLKSGEKSPFYIDLRLIMSAPELLKLVAKGYASLLDRPGLAGKKFDRIAGIPAAGLPLATAVSLETGIPMIFPRLNAKSHGTGRQIEGYYEEGERVLLLDDLITSGTSKLEALEVLRSGGLKVDHLVVLLERGTRGRTELEAAGVQLEALANVTEFFPLLQASGAIDAAKRSELEAFAGRTQG